MESRRNPYRLTRRLFWVWSVERNHQRNYLPQLAVASLSLLCQDVPTGTRPVCRGLGPGSLLARDLLLLRLKSPNVCSPWLIMGIWGGLDRISNMMDSSNMMESVIYTASLFISFFLDPLTCLSPFYSKTWARHVCFQDMSCLKTDKTIKLVCYTAACCHGIIKLIILFYKYTQCIWAIYIRVFADKKKKCIRLLLRLLLLFNNNWKYRE